MKRMRARQRQRGQGMTEYIIIVAVVAILSIGIMVRFGDQLRNLFSVATDQAAGGTQNVTLENRATDEYNKGISDLDSVNQDVD